MRRIKLLGDILYQIINKYNIAFFPSIRFVEKITLLTTMSTMSFMMRQYKRRGEPCLHANRGRRPVANELPAEYRPVSNWTLNICNLNFYKLEFILQFNYGVIGTIKKLCKYKALHPCPMIQKGNQNLKT